MTWTIQELGAAGEFVGAIGVVVTLGYLAYQIRQNTSQLEQNSLLARAAAQKASYNALRVTRQSLFESEEVSEIFLKGSSNPEELSETARLRFRLVMQNVTEVMLEIHSQTLATGFSPETWHTQGVSLVERILGTTGGRAFWSEFATNYPQDFRREVERIIGDSTGVGSGAR